MTPSPFRAVGQWYQEFTQTSDAEVRDLLIRAMPPIPGASVVSSPPQDRGA
jgi:predicted phosphoribosyltransferase